MLLQTELGGADCRGGIASRKVGGARQFAS